MCLIVRDRLVPWSVEHKKMKREEKKQKAAEEALRLQGEEEW